MTGFQAPEWVHEITPGSIGIWVLVAGVVGTLIKTWPALQLQVMNAKAALRSEDRADRRDYQTQIDELREEFHKIEIKLTAAIQANRILDSGLEAIDPNNLSLLHARQILSTAFTISPSTDAPLQMPEGL